MHKHLLSLRLAQVAEFVPEKARLADIGSDHAYLPVALIAAAKISFAVAGEVAPGPFRSAQKQIEKYQLSEHIQARLADGLAAISETDVIDTITICGMGGLLICSILAQGLKTGHLPESAMLILQPNNHEFELRKWLADHDYQIKEEAIVEDHGKIYEIICACHWGRTAYSQFQLYFGPRLLAEKSAVFQKKWHQKKLSKEKVVANLQKSHQAADKIKQQTRYLDWIKEVLQ